MRAVMTDGRPAAVVVEGPGAELVQELLEGGAVSAGAAGGLGEHPIAAGALELGLLVGGGDAA